MAMETVVLPRLP